MQDDELVFVTLSNAASIVRQIPTSSLDGAQGDIYKKKIYCLSDKEKRRLYAIKMFFQDPAAFMSKYYVPAERKSNPNFVFEAGAPAYHCVYDCERLHSDYTNYEIPPQIRIKGEQDPSVIPHYREWFKSNMHLLESERTKFQIRFFGEFKFEPDLKLIERPNSGVTQFQNLNLDQLEDRIDQLIKEAASLYHNDQVINRWGKQYWLGRMIDKPILNNKDNIDEKVIRQRLVQYDTDIISPLKHYLVEYYRVKYNNQLSFSGKLLAQLGFIACGACYSSRPNRQNQPSQSTATP